MWHPLSGGSMGEVWRCSRWVVKLHPDAPPGLFQSEARGLDALARAGVRVPQVHLADDAGIVMDWLPPGPSDPVSLAEQVARLHDIRRSTYGGHHPVFLGRYPLPDSPAGDDWAAFWADHRILPLVSETRRQLGPLAGRIERLLGAYQPPVEGPVLLHGDLWAGNVVHSADGAALIDPSVWCGERAVDLAMMRLFGGFDGAFWRRYRALRPIPDSVERAIPFYQLYYLLVHVLFFGAGYLGGVRRVLETYDV